MKKKISLHKIWNQLRTRKHKSNRLPEKINKMEEEVRCPSCGQNTFNINFASNEGLLEGREIENAILESQKNYIERFGYEYSKDVIYCWIMFMITKRRKYLKYIQSQGCDLTDDHFLIKSVTTKER